MKIKRIKLINFRQFYGKNNIIDFSIDPERNVTLIHAENGVGKTTLLNSILWCFYDKFTADFEQQKNIINIDAEANGINQCEVEVEFIHEGKTYGANRRYDGQTQKSTLDLFIIDNGSYQPIRSERRLLNSVIPEDMAEYFLFHGEGISQLQSKESNFRKAIRDILGFTLAEQAIHDLDVIKQKWKSRLQKINANQNKFIKAHSELNNHESDLKGMQEKQQQLMENISDFNAEKRSLEEAIINCKNTDATDLKKRLSNTEDTIRRRNHDLQRENSKRQRLISTYGWKVFGIELSESSLDFIDTSTLTGRIPAPYDETLVNDIVSSGLCICGRDVKEGTLEHEKIVGLLDRANTPEIKNNIMKARSFAQTIGNGAQTFIEEYNDINLAIKKLHNELANLGDLRDDLNIKIDDIDDTILKELRAKEREVASKLSRAEASINSLVREINAKLAVIQQIKREVEKHSPQDAESYQIYQSIAFIEELISLCNVKLSETETQSKILIAADVNEILSKFSRKDFSVKVSDSFNFELIREGGGIVAKSKGEKLLLNLAFVSALIKMAAQRSKAEGKFLQPGTVAPFIIDAPFGELDETYRKATARFLPENSEQLVLLLSSSHWRGTVGEEIKSKVGREYILVSHKKSARGSKPLDEINIYGKVLNQSNYDSDFDGTSILEVK
ncbi:AAA family ATPase [Aeromonas enteropelogenes]|uniref:AAA family ATPase n=1 Tax=Aeromonas enteropelogenes TaxID=29489 RepID=A0ABU9JB21_AEREN